MIATLSTFIGETPCDVEFEFVKGEPAYTSGLPENCHPGIDDECSILKVELVKGDNRIDVTDFISEDENKGLIEECLEHVEQSAEDYDGQD